MKILHRYWAGRAITVWLACFLLLFAWIAVPVIIVNALIPGPGISLELVVHSEMIAAYILLATLMLAAIAIIKGRSLEFLKPK